MKNIERNFGLLTKFSWLFLVCTFVFCSRIEAQPFPLQDKVNVDVYVYHLKPPFIVNNAQKIGLYFDFSDYLNTKNERYHFETVFVPRKRIETMLASKKFNGILLGVSPIWFGDKSETKYLWTTSFFQDQDEVVSITDVAFEYTGPKSITGKVFGGVRGFYYFGIDELVNSGEISRYNTIGEYELLQMLLLERVDVGIVSRSTLNFLYKEKNWKNQFYLSKKPHDKYQRRILVPKYNKAIFDEISPIIDNLKHDPAWQKLIEKY